MRSTFVCVPQVGDVVCITSEVAEVSEALRGHLGIVTTVKPNIRVHFPAVGGPDFFISEPVTAIRHLIKGVDRIERLGNAVGVYDGTSLTRHPPSMSPVRTTVGIPEPRVWVYFENGMRSDYLPRSWHLLRHLPLEKQSAVHAKPFEAPCISCGRMNDVGVKVCWCCGGKPS